MSKISPGINTCQECQQWVNDCKGLVENEETHTRDNMTKTQTDDETEFARIPIAGENDSDYDTDSDEYKEEEDSRLPYLDGDNRVKDNLSDTDDDEFPLIPIVHAITGTNTSDKEQENQTKVKEDGGGTFNIALTSTLIENITTPTRKKDVPPIPSFDASIAYLNRPFPEDTDAFAFLFGKRRDGIIKHHRLSPIPIHENRYQTLYIEDQASLTFKTDAAVDIDAPSNKTEKRKKIKNKKQKKKASGSRFDGKDFDFDFTDEGYPLALFQTGGEQMRNDYEANKRKRSLSPVSSIDSNESLEIYYKAYNTYHPEIGESNAESVERTRLMEQRIQLLKKDRKKGKVENLKDDQSHNDKLDKSKATTNKYLPGHDLNATTLSTMNLSLTCCSCEQGIKLKMDTSENRAPKPTQVPTINEDEKEIYTNNASTYDFQEEEPQITLSRGTHQIEVIMDTGATFSMLPGHFEFAWTNLKPCLHTIKGCFKGGAQTIKHRWENFTL
jgi:hypothetical protein